MLRWLNIAADMICATANPKSKDTLRGRLWDVISSELDVDRAQLAVMWWSDGGKEHVLGMAELTD